MVISFGELLWDLLPSGAVLGGAPANFAYRLNSLGEQTFLVSRVGQDELGRRALDLVSASNLSTAFIQQDPVKPTGAVPILLDTDGAPDFTILPDVAYDYIEFSPELRALAPSARCICFGTLVQRAPASRASLLALLQSAPDALKVCDLNLRKDCFTPETIRSSLEAADILKLNDDEARYLNHLFELGCGSISEIARALQERWGLDYCVVTQGAKGALAASATKELVEAPSQPVQVVDTCGAGDAFTAGFISRILAGAALPEALAFGNRLGGIVAGQPGATTPIPQHTLADLTGISPN